MSRAQRLADEMGALFEAVPARAPGLGTQLLSPTRAQEKAAVALSAGFDPVDCLPEIARLLAGDFAASLEQTGLRPADFARTPDLAGNLLKALHKSLREGAESFEKALADSLAGRG